MFGLGQKLVLESFQLYLVGGFFKRFSFFLNKNRAKSRNSNHYERCATQINISDNPGYDILAIYYVFVQV